MRYIIETPSFKLAFSILFGFVWLFLYINLIVDYTKFVGYSSSIMLVFLSFWLVLRAFLMKNSLFLLFFSFIFLYTIPPKLFFFDRVFLSFHNPSYTEETVASVTLIFSLFLIVLNSLLQMPTQPKKNPLVYRKNDTIFWLLVIFSVIFVVIGKSGESLLSGYGYGQAEQTSSSLNEYVLILFLFAYIYSAGEKRKWNILYILSLIYMLKNLLYGGRIEVVMLALMFYALHLQYIISFKKTVIFLIIGIWIMQIVGTVRGNPQLLIEGDIVSVLNPFSKDDSGIVYQNSNEGDVYWASERMLLLMNDGELNTVDRIKSTAYFALSVITPISVLPKEANLSNYKIDKRTTGGGGLAPIYFYVFGGLIGVILLGIFLALQLNFFRKKFSMIKYVYLILLITTLPRWFAYYPIHLIKFCLWGILGYMLIISFDYTIKKYMTICSSLDS